MIFNRTNFRIHSLVPKDEYGYQVKGLHVTPDYTEVTNGHYLIRVDAPFKGSREEMITDLPIVNGHAAVKKGCEFIIPVAAAKEVERNIPKKSGMPILENAWLVDDKEEEATFMTTDLETHKPVSFRKILRKFPNTEAVIPKEKAPISIGFDPDYMMQLCQQYKKAGIDCVSLSLYGLTKAMKIEGTTDAETDQSITSVLMPKKNNNDTWVD